MRRAGVRLQRTASRGASRTSCERSLALDLDQVGVRRSAPAVAGGGGRRSARVDHPEHHGRNRAQRPRRSRARSDDGSLPASRSPGASGTLDGDGLTVHWLRPVPPIDHAQAKLRIIDPDTIEITAQSGRQRQEGKRGEAGNGGLALRGGRMRITGIMHPDQFGAIEIDAGGGLPDVIALLKNPRLAAVEQASGRSARSGRAGLRSPERATAVGEQGADGADRDPHPGASRRRASRRRSPRDATSTKASLDLEASNDGMKLNGRRVAREHSGADRRRDGFPRRPAFAGAAEDHRLRRGQREAARGCGARRGSGAVRVRQPCKRRLTERRDGRGQLDVAADLTQAELAASPLDLAQAGRQPCELARRVCGSVTTSSSAWTIILVSGARLDRARPGRLRRAARRACCGWTASCSDEPQATGTVRFPPANGTGPIQATFNGAAPRPERTHVTPEQGLREASGSEGECRAAVGGRRAIRPRRSWARGGGDGYRAATSRTMAT